MRIRIHRPVNKSSTPINTTLVAKQQKQQPANHPKLDAPNPKFNFDLSKIPISSPHRSSQLPPTINPKLVDNKSSDRQERETESKNSETAVQTFASSPSEQPQEADESKKQLQQPELRAKSELQQPKADILAKIKTLSSYNFDLSKIPISSPHRSSQPSPKINCKSGDKRSSDRQERETESKNSETTIQTFTPSPPEHPQEADETKKQLQQPELRAKSESQPKKADVFAEIKRLSRYNFDLTKIPISAPNLPPLQSKQNFDLPSPERVQQPIDGKRERSLSEEPNNSAISSRSASRRASPLIPIDNSDFADRVSQNERSPQEYSDQFPYQPKVARKPLITNPWQKTVMFSTVQRDILSTKEDNSQELTAPSTASTDIEASIQQTKGGGQPLEDKVREPMEQAFGADFSGVRIHTDSSAVGMNQELGAQAFTHGNDIYFDDGKYNPQSSEGKHLLAHELTHTVQQGASIQRKVKISTGLSPTIQLLPDFIKRGVNWLAERTIPGYTLLNVVLGKNLITGAAVARSGVNLIKGYMRLSPVTGSILLSELEETESLPQAGKWVEGQVAKFGIDFNDIARRLKLMWDEMSGWKGIDWNIKVFKKHFGPVIGKVMAFSSVVMEKVKELRFEGALRLVGATELLNALKQDPKAFKKAIDNPKEVLKQFMVGALKKGFANFKDNFVTHFKAALLGWLFGKAAEMGVQMPKEFNVAGIFSLVAQLVGATYQQIRKTVVKRLGAKGEKIVSKLEAAVSFIKNLVTKGPVALWEMVASSLSNLKEMLFSQIATLVSTEIIKTAVTKLLSMLNPAGAIVQLALTLYRVIKFFIDNWETIKSVALGILNSIAMVALNKVGAAASFVEKVMAQGMKLIISFLARIFGLGGIVGKVKALIKKLSNPVKKAIAKVIDWIVAKGKKAAKKLFKGKKKDKSAKGLSKDVKAKVKKDTIKLTKKQYKTVEEFDKALEGIYLNYKSQGLQSLSVKGVQTDPEKPFQIVAKASPETPVTLVKWKDLFKEGTEPEGATKKFAKAGDSTYALLIVNNQPVTKVVRSDKKGHAEDNLMNTSGWKNALNKAYQDAVSVPPKKTDIKVVINRTPCHKRCSPKLSNELNKYWQRFNKDDTKQYVNFYLIATGVYETKGSLSNREAGGPTTNRDLEMLARAGWHLQGLQVGEKPTSRGKILSDYLQKILTKLRKVKAPG